MMYCTKDNYATAWSRLGKDVFDIDFQTYHITQNDIIFCLKKCISTESEEFIRVFLPMGVIAYMRKDECVRIHNEVEP